MRTGIWAGLAFALGACLAAAVPATAQEGSDPIQATHGDWTVRCGQVCYMEQVKSDDEGRPLLLMRLRRLPEAQDIDGKVFIAQAEMVTRLGFLLPPGMVLTVDAGEPQRIPFERCQPNGCGSRPLLASTIVDELKLGGEATVSMALDAEREIRISVSLSGFTAAFDEL